MIDIPDSNPSSDSLRPAHVVARCAAAIVGGWIFVWGFIAAGIALLLAAGMPFNDARNLVHLLAFVVFLSVFFWAFIAPKLPRVAIVLVGGGTAMTAAAWLMTGSGT